MITFHPFSLIQQEKRLWATDLEISRENWRRTDAMIVSFSPRVGGGLILVWIFFPIHESFDIVLMEARILITGRCCSTISMHETGEERVSLIRKH